MEEKAILKSAIELAKTFLTNVKGLAFETESPASVVPVEKTKETIKLMDVKTLDGKTISVDKLEVGGVCTIDGAPLADGEYVLEDNSTLVVVGGIITEIKAPEAASTEVEVEMSKELDKTKEDVTALSKELEALKLSIQTKNAEVAQLKSELEMKPAASPILLDAQKEKKVEEMNSFQQFMYYRKQNQK